MRKNIRILGSVLALTLVLGLFGTTVFAGTPTYDPHLVTLGFDTLGPPGTAFNSEIVIDAGRKFAYVGSVDFNIFAGLPPVDISVKAVDVSDPAHPVMTDAEPAVGDNGPFDVKIAGNVLAASTQDFTTLSNPGVTLMDISNPADPVLKSHLGSADLSSPSGSHNSFLWQDPQTGKIWLFATGLDLTSLKIYDVTNPAAPVFNAEYNNGAPYVHDNFVQENGGRVLEYQAGSIGVEILDVTRIVRGGQTGMLTFAGDVVAYNHYTSDPADAATVTRPGFAHYIEPTESGDVTWVGDEAGCGKPAIIHSFDATNLPAPGAAPKFLTELGTIIDNPDSVMCNGLIHAGNFNAQSQEYRWTGHNFDIWGNGLLIRGDYGRGVSVHDITDPAAAVRVATSRGLNQLVGDENQAQPGREKFLESYPFFWQAVYDGDLIYGSDINQGIFVLDLVGD